MAWKDIMRADSKVIALSETKEDEVVEETATADTMHQSECIAILKDIQNCVHEIHHKLCECDKQEPSHELVETITFNERR